MNNDSCTPSKAGDYPSDCEVREGYRQLVREKAGQETRSKS